MLHNIFHWDVSLCVSLNKTGRKHYQGHGNNLTSVAVLHTVASNDYMRCGIIFVRHNKLFTLVCLKFPDYQFKSRIYIWNFNVYFTEKKLELHNESKTTKCYFSGLVAVNLCGKKWEARPVFKTCCFWSWRTFPSTRHYIKSVYIRSYSGPNAGKCGPE